MELSVLQFAPPSPCLFTVHYWVKPGSLPFILFSQVFVNFDKIPTKPSVLQARQTVPAFSASCHTTDAPVPMLVALNSHLCAPVSPA